MKYSFYKITGIVLIATIMLVSCSKDGGNGNGPKINSITPSSGASGDNITISGSNLSNSTVEIGGIAAGTTANTETSITTRIPIGSTIGVKQVKVSNAQGSATSSITVSSIGLPPVITGITPSSVARGGQITITGTGMANAAVRIATVNAVVTASTATSLTVTIPSSGIADGSAAVEVSNGLGIDTKTITIIP